MPLLRQKITQEHGLFNNDHFSLEVTIAALPDDLYVTKAWMTIKSNPADADPGIVQKTITTSAVVGTGQITDSGSSSGSATMQFDFVPSDTVLLTARRQYSFDVQVMYSDNTVHTVIGDSMLVAGQGVTAATS